VATGAVEAAAAALVDAGLALPDPALDARRAVVASPLTGHDPVEVTPAGDLADALVAALVAARLPGALPPKFGVVVDTGGAIPVAPVPADVLLAAARRHDGGVAWTAVAGPSPRVEIGVVAETDLVTFVGDLARRCAASGARAGELPGLDGHPADGPPPAPPVAGVLRHLDPARANVIGAPPLGRLTPAQLRGVAAAARHGLGLRLTPAGSVALVGVSRAALGDVRRRLAEAGCSTDPADPWLGVSACVGTDGCPAALADTHAAARQRVAERSTTGARHPIHLSGCDKRCGAPAGARLLVAGPDGRFAGARP
jgi:precorrin-3B synthase